MDHTETIMDALREVPDPELGIDIVELGLIYDVQVERSHVEITFSLTQRACPMRTHIEDAIHEAVNRLFWVESVSTSLTFDPAWTPERMSDDAKVVFGTIPQAQGFVDPSRFSSMRSL